MESGNFSHGLDQKCTQARSLVAEIYLCRQGRKRGWGSRLGDGPNANCIDTRRKVIQGSIPAERDRTAASDDLARPIVDEEHLEMGMAGNQLPEISPCVIAVMVVFRPDAVEMVFGVNQLPQIRTILGRDYL